MGQGVTKYVSLSLLRWVVLKLFNRHHSIIRDIGLFLPPRIRCLVQKLPAEFLEKTQELRLRHSRPLMLHWSDGEACLGHCGVVEKAKDAYIIRGEDLEKTLELISNHSLYAFEEELRQGYITLPGGHRVGLAGKTVVEKGTIKIISNISGLNIRFARQVKGTGERVLPFLVDRLSGRLYHTLIISPPQGGKTTMLRDLARLISDGSGILVQGKKVGIVDERSEIAGSFRGVPQLEVGMRSDVLDACPKAEGIMLMLRSLSPQVIVTDELGREADVEAVTEAMHCGVTVISSVHGSNLEELCRRPVLEKLLKNSYFERLVFLSSARGPGTLESIVEGERGLPLFSSHSKGE